jgi:hypothetical protein
MIVAFELEKPLPDLDVPGLMIKDGGLETNGLTYAPLGWRVSGTTYCGCRASCSRNRRRRGRGELGLPSLLGLIHDPSEEQLDLVELLRNGFATGHVMLAVFRGQFAHLPDDLVHVVAVDLQLLKSVAGEGQGILRRWTACVKQCVQ